jgi:hypothetical protein
MGRAVTAVIFFVIIFMAVPASDASAEVKEDVHLEEGYTGESRMTQVDIVLKGEDIVSADFVFTVLDDIFESESDSFIFTVTNLDSPDIKKSLQGTTDAAGRLTRTIPFTRNTSPRWRVQIECTQAGDQMIGPITVAADDGNDWDLQVFYEYKTKDGDNGGGDGGADGGEPVLVRAFNGNLILVALVSLLVAVISLRGFKDAANLRPSFFVAGVLLLDAFLSIPVAMLVNQEEHGVAIAGPPFGPEWLGNLAVVLFVLWLVPFVAAKRRVLTSDSTRRFLERITTEGLARRVHSLGSRFEEDSLGERGLTVLFILISLASVVVAGIMVLN